MHQGLCASCRQWVSWIHITDLVAIIQTLISDSGFQGPINATAPHPITNTEYTKTLGKVLRRPTIAPMPAFAARLAFGKMADELLLSSLRVHPKELLDKGFVFEEPLLEGALRTALAETR